MTNDGSHLEGLVAFVEQVLLPQGFDVKTNQRVYNDEGVQIAEFDVQVRGKVGSTEIAWLIECRDRPGSGPAPASWVEQLVGRRLRFRFNKVTAVSTTGFATGAVEFARTQGIELREVSSLSPEAFSSWLDLRHIKEQKRQANLENAKVLLPKDSPEELRSAVLNLLNGANGATKLLRSTGTGELHSMNEAFLGAVNSQELFDQVVPNSEGQQVNLHVIYENEKDCFVLDTEVGPVRLDAIVFTGTLVITETLVPLSVITEYHNSDTGEVISQLAAFEPQEIYGMRLAIEMHRIEASGAMHIVMRRLPDEV